MSGGDAVIVDQAATRTEIEDSITRTRAAQQATEDPADHAELTEILDELLELWARS